MKELKKLFRTNPSSAIRFLPLTITITPSSTYTELTQLLEAIVDYAYQIAIPIAVVMVVYGGIRLLMAKGNPAEVSAGKAIIKWALVGLIVLTIGNGFIVLLKDILGV